MALEASPWFRVFDFREMMVQNLKELAVSFYACSWLACELSGDRDLSGSLNHQTVRSQKLLWCVWKGNAIFLPVFKVRIHCPSVSCQQLNVWKSVSSLGALLHHYTNTAACCLWPSLLPSVGSFVMPIFRSKIYPWRAETPSMLCSLERNRRSM